MDLPADDLPAPDVDDEIEVEEAACDDAGGTTVIWYDTPYRYELFGRTFVPTRVLQDMSETMVPLASLGAATS
jgi:hypothetical protein